MVFKEEICLWFKNSESRHRLELICGLINMCVPLELKFIRTCVDDLGKRDDMLRDYDSKANNKQEFSQLSEILDERTRSKLIVYVALLEANNQTCSKLIFEKLISSPELSPMAFSDKDKSYLNYVTEMLLIYTMVLHHPAFTFEEKRVIGEKFQALENLSGKSLCHWNSNKSQFGLQCSHDDLALESCHRDQVSSSQAYEACDSGLSIGTEPEAELLSDHAYGSASIQAQDSRVPSIDNTTFENFSGSVGEIGQCNTTIPIKPNPSIPRCARNPNAVMNQPRPKNSTASASSVNGPNSCGQSCPCGPANREPSSSGSGESLDMYGESVTVPTTYIYNSSIYEHQNINEMPTMALSNNLIDMTPGYMCHQNGNCHFYRYPLLSNPLPSVSVPRKSHATSLETSSSEEGGSTVIAAKLQRVSLNSPSSSPQSSPYASPPQSLSPSRAASPRENKLCSAIQSSSISCVTGTTTSVVMSKASPRPPSRHCSSSSSLNGSHPSSPALASNTQTYRNKPTMTSKSSRYPNDRCNVRRSGQVNAQDNVITSNVSDNPMSLAEANSVDCCSNNQLNVYEENNIISSTDIPFSKIAPQSCDRNFSSRVVDRILDPLVTTDIGSSVSSTSTLAVANCDAPKEGIVSSKANSAVNFEFINSDDHISTKPDDISLASDERTTNFHNMNGHSFIPGKEQHVSNHSKGLNGFVSTSSAHSVPVMTSVPSGSCSNIIPDAVKSTRKIYNSSSQDQEKSSMENRRVNNVDSNSACDIQLLNGTANARNANEECVANVTSSSDMSSHVNNTVVVLSSHSSSNLASGKSIVVNSSNMKTSVSQSSNRFLQNQTKEPYSSIGTSQSLVSTGNKSTGNTSVYTTTTTNSTASMVPMVASHGTYPPFFSLPLLPGGTSPYLIQGGFPHHGPMRTPSQAYFVASSGLGVHNHPSHFIKGGRNHHMLPPPANFNGGNIKSRMNGCGGRSGSSSSSSSSIGRKKTLSRGMPFPNKSLSSDSSPSSSQYSSPPQTPSPDHTKDARKKLGKPNDTYPQEDVWEADSKGICVSNVPHDDMPPIPPMNSHMMMPPNPIRHQRYIQFPHPLGYVGYPHPPPGLFRYSLTTPMVMGPRPPTPLNSEKSSRETTPPSHPLIGGTEVQKSVEYLNAISSLPSSVPYNCNIPIASRSSGSSSSSPPIVPAPNPEASAVALVPPPGSSNVHACTQNGGMQYNPSSYPMFAMSSGQYVGHLPGLFSSPNTVLPNGYVSPHSLPPNFPLSTMGNVMNSDLVYPSQYPVMGQTAPSISSCGGQNGMHSSNGPAYTSLYHTPPPSTVPIPPPLKKPQTCYNCGKGGHRGSECKEASMDDLTKHTKIL